MSKGTAALGKKGVKKTHIRCRRCGHHAYNVRDRRCASCGFGAIAKRRNYRWAKEK
ncbi:MAG: 50S ribosomal protein L37e [Euryarchaeota archaeon]|nr:50S ribosomal protein L37e [Euryarchaeota archaeon]